MLDKYSENLKNSKGHLSNAVIATYINLKENLSGEEISFVENHISKCDECRKRLEEMIQEDTEIDEERNSKITKLPVSAWPSQDGQDYNIRKNRYYIWAAAAMIVIAAGIGIYYYLLSPKRVIVENNKPVTDSLSIKENNQTIGESQEKTENYNKEDFAVNEILENFVDRNIRSEEGVEILSPGIGDTLKGRIKLKWKSFEPEKNFHIIVVNNKNKKIWESTTHYSNTFINKRLQPGLYYWKIEERNKLVALGKFIVER